MYHELTAQKKASDRRARTIGFVVVCVLVAACFFAYSLVSANLREQGAAALRTSILESAMQCCAIEGSYPSSLAHLEQDYGLYINHNDYTITYEVFAGNVMPSVVVVPR